MNPLLSLSLSLDLMEALVSDTHNKGIKCTITGYNHIDSVDECALAISIGYVFLQLRYMLVGGKLVPLGGEPCGIRGRILMSRFCSSIPQHLEPVVWAPRSLVTTDLSRQGQRIPQGGRRIGSWQPVAVLLTEAGLPHCLFPWIPCTSCSSVRNSGWHSAQRDTAAPP